MRTCLFTAVVLLTLFSSAAADGKFYIGLSESEAVPPDLPYQRTVIAHDGQRELLILQSKFEGNAKDFGWIVPVPSLPKMASIDRDSCNMMFYWLGDTSKPNISSIKKLLIYVMFMACAGFVVFLIAGTANRKARGKGPTKFFFMDKAAVILFLMFLIPVIAYFTTGPMFEFLLGSFSAGDGVTVYDSRKIGIYDVTVLKSGNSKDLTEWLDMHNYRYDDSDIEAFDSYIRQSMYFVAARVDPSEIGADGKTFYFGRGLIDPLVLLFESDRIFYPLALTGTMEKDTVVLLYVFHKNKVIDPSGRMRMRYFGKHDVSLFFRDIEFVPDITAGSFNMSQNGLTKFKASLSSDRMKEDLVLAEAADNEPYRENIYQWDTDSVYMKQADLVRGQPPDWSK